MPPLPKEAPPSIFGETEMYQFNDNVNEVQFFLMRKDWIDSGAWAALPKASKAVLPVIAAHVNQHGIAFPGERTIAILSGRTDKVARSGIEGLASFPGLNIKNTVTPRGHRMKIFRLDLPNPKDKRKRGSFPLYRAVFDGGNWRQLKPSAQALYPVMRHFGFFDLDFFAHLEDLSISREEFKEYYLSRPYDLCNAEIGEMARLAGIDRRSMGEALESLEECYLIEPVHSKYLALKGWKVFLKPKQYTDSEVLNEQVFQAYSHVL